MTSTAPLVLASTSRYRRELLQRLRLPFTVQAPQVDETPRSGEAPASLALRLAGEKAREVALRFADSVVIGADQVAELDGQPIGKPGVHSRAVAQLRQMSGREVIFQTALAVVVAHADGSVGFERSALVPVRVTFRALTDDEIEHYLHTERPYDCAGSAKVEALGISLLQRLQADDPTALIGLPLIKTCEFLRDAGIDPLKFPVAG